MFKSLQQPTVWWSDTLVLAAGRC